MGGRRRGGGLWAAGRSVLNPSASWAAVGRGLSPFCVVWWSSRLAGFGFVLVLVEAGSGLVGGDDCVLSKNKSGELRLNLSRS